VQDSDRISRFVSAELTFSSVAITGMKGRKMLVANPESATSVRQYEADRGWMSIASACQSGYLVCLPE